MEIKNFIKIYDDVLPLKVLSNLIRYINTIKFEKAAITTMDHNDVIVDFNIRRTHVRRLTELSDSISEVHWFNFLGNIIKNNIFNYIRDIKSIDCAIKTIKDISILKYENTGFYTWHTDHGLEEPRTLSIVLLLNNDYEGGNLCFRNPDGSGEWEVEVKPNRMIIWPSNFLYPHTVKPVSKGIRYSMVSWAI
jgi:predicted 2-oxoglutarate/Fe(II)-dependent dioxygenase YbiX